MPNPNPPPPPKEHQFLPGISGNPGGVGKENISNIMKRFLEMPITELKALFADEEAKGKLTAKEAIALTQVARAIEGKDYPTDRVIDRTEGKAVQTVNINGLAEIDETRRLLANMLGYEPSNEGASATAE